MSTQKICNLYKKLKKNEIFLKKLLTNVNNCSIYIIYTFKENDMNINLNELLKVNANQEIKVCEIGGYLLTAIYNSKVDPIDLVDKDLPIEQYMCYVYTNENVFFGRGESIEKAIYKAVNELASKRDEILKKLALS